MRQKIEAAIASTCKDLFNIDVPVVLTRPDEQFGDYATNVALQLSKQLGKNPRDIAEAIKSSLKHDMIAHVEIAGPGFINLALTDEALLKSASQKPAQNYKGQEILVEFGDPNPFKEMHLGHLYTTIIGDAIAHLFEVSGATVRRLSYQGDVGMHVAKAIWGMKQEGLHEKGFVDGSASFNEQALASFIHQIGLYYAKGSQAFESDEKVAQEIKEINEHVYKRDDRIINALYDWGRRQSLNSFKLIFDELGVVYDQPYFESESTPEGVKFVQQNIGKVFEESEGAIVFRGEKVGLHTRVFINSRGLPTYEAKDLGLAELKNKKYPNAYKSVIITAHEQAEYFKVMLAALNEIDPELAQKTMHIAHGFLSLTTGKMSSRTGDVYSATSLMSDVRAASKAAYPDSTVQDQVYLAALKYTFLKNRIGGDVIFDIESSVSLEGNSGPYLQYAHARARSILAKTEAGDVVIDHFEPAERSLVRKLSEYTDVVDKAVTELMPHHVATYLYELAQNFNSFYEHNRVLGDERERLRIHLVGAYADTLKNGLELLNIPAPERM